VSATLAYARLTDLDRSAEERVARARYRRGQRLARARARAAKQAWRRRLRRLIAASAEDHPRCRCELRADMTREQLMGLGAGCTASRYLGDVGWVCPRLDHVRRRLGL
jgi:hypothetical protein